MPVSPTYGTGLVVPYVRLLVAHKGFRTLWLGELLNSAGGWFAYVATLRRVSELAPPAMQGRLLAAVLATHYIPGLLLFPLAGVMADRLPKELVLAGACAVGSLSAASLALVRGPGDLALLLGLLIIQFSATTVYEPTRRSLTPSLVPPGEALRLATTLDSVGWSIMSAAGASAGGAVLGRWGYGVCYGVDAATYAVSCLAALSLRGRVGRGRGGGGGSGGGSGGAAAAAVSAVAAPEHANHPATGRASLEMGGRLKKARRSDPSAVGGGGSPPRPPPPGTPGGPAPPSSSSASSLGAAFKAAAGDVRAGFTYVAAPANRPILALACVKAAGSTVWGAADLVNTYVSEQPGAQASAAAVGAAWGRLVGKAPPTAPPTPESLSAAVLGAIFACVGVGCFCGPLLANALTPAPAHTPALRRALTGAFACLCAGYVGIAALSTSLGGVLVATGVRAAGSAILWANSTLLLQLAVPDALLGRVCSLEQAFFVTGECVSAMLAAVCFDVAGASVRTVCVVMAGVAAGVTGAWGRYCARLEVEEGSGGEPGHGHGHGRSSADAEAAAGGGG